jgi:hypothetical protein
MGVIAAMLFAPFAAAYFQGIVILPPSKILDR